MAAPTAKQLSDAYDLICEAEKAAITTLKTKGLTFLADLDAAVANLPTNRSAQSAGLNNLMSWRNTIQSIVSSVDSVLAQYPADAPEA